MRLDKPGTLEGLDLSLCRVLLDDFTRTARTIFKNGHVLQIIYMDAGTDEIRRNALRRFGWKRNNRILRTCSQGGSLH